jgi:hypothetical protein
MVSADNIPISRYPDIAWRDIIGLRIVLAHHYHRVDPPRPVGRYLDLAWDSLRPESAGELNGEPPVFPGIPAGPVARTPGHRRPVSTPAAIQDD